MERGVRRPAAAPLPARRRARGASRARSRRRTRQVAPLNARLATVAKPVSSSRSASSRCAVRSAEGSDGIVGAHAPAVHAAAAGAHEQRARLPHEPRAEPRRARARARCGRAARAPRGRRGRRAGRARSAPRAASRRRARRARPSRRGWRAAPGSPTRARARAPTPAPAPARSRRGSPPWRRTGRCGPRCSASTAARARAARAASTGARHATAARSGSAGARGAPWRAAALAAGDRAPQDHEVGVGGQRRHLARLPLALAHHGVVAGLELLAERG